MIDLEKKGKVAISKLKNPIINQGWGDEEGYKAKIFKWVDNLR